MNPATLGMMQIITGAACWGTLGILGTTLKQLDFSSAEVAALRITLAFALLLPALPWFWPQLRRLQYRDLPMLALQSLIGMLGMSLCYFAAVSRIGPSLAVALLYTAPVWSLILARLLLGEGITRQSALLAVVAAAGVALTLGDGLRAHPAGMAFGLGAGICYALYGVLGKRAMRGHPPMLVFFTSIGFSALALCLLPDTRSAFARLAGQPADVWLSAAGLALVGTLAAFALFVKGLQKMPAARAAVFTVFEPLTAIALAAWLLNERLGGWQYAGVALILAAAIGNALPRRKPCLQPSEA
ncbi:DMT family transporter [Uruburuella testudinis]|uniref:DMT family transporter n=1 Tax=Uruburuella testudinis TaxID=1282863 RepID=A0ABY4DRR5_9NEIS|nr:EamA family transporter [Uruburuella testudinis]UOO81721.1 DMT family transporter [Uruburuella testudinis]